MEGVTRISKCPDCRSEYIDDIVCVDEQDSGNGYHYDLVMLAQCCECKKVFVRLKE